RRGRTRTSADREAPPRRRSRRAGSPGVDRGRESSRRRGPECSRGFRVRSCMASLLRSTLRRTEIGRVPVEVSREVHHRSENPEESCGTEEQRKILELEKHVEIAVEAGEQSRHRGSAPQATEYLRRVPRDQSKRCERGDRVCGAEAELFRYGKKDQVE